MLEYGGDVDGEVLDVVEHWEDWWGGRQAAVVMSNFGWRWWCGRSSCSLGAKSDSKDSAGQLSVCELGSKINSSKSELYYVCKMRQGDGQS